MKKKKLLNRLLSALLAVIMTIGLIPMGSVTVKAETKNATLSNLGALGTVKIGSKSESGLKPKNFKSYVGSFSVQ